MSPLNSLQTRFSTNGSSPLYKRLQDTIRTAINENDLETNDLLPAEREIAQELNISRITVRKAIEGLVQEGLLTRRQGSGTFVADRVEKSFAALTSFTEDMVSRGFKPGSHWLARETGTVTPEEALTLGLSPGTPVYRLNRIRYADNVPMALEFTTVPAFAISSPESIESSLYEALGQQGYRPGRALQRLRAILFSDEHAKLLDIAPGSAGLLIERRAFSEKGTAVEHTQSYYRGDAYDFVAELSLTHMSPSGGGGHGR